MVAAYSKYFALWCWKEYFRWDNWVLVDIRTRDLLHNMPFVFVNISNLISNGEGQLHHLQSVDCNIRAWKFVWLRRVQMSRESWRIVVTPCSCGNFSDIIIVRVVYTTRRQAYAVYPTDEHISWPLKWWGFIWLPSIKPLLLFLVFNETVILNIFMVT
jgi:hypothetical protein